MPLVSEIGPIRFVRRLRVAVCRLFPTRLEIAIHSGLRVLSASVVNPFSHANFRLNPPIKSP